ncbi:hypothetical protein ACLB2K_023438 [Fragaria x ananassa]
MGFRLPRISSPKRSLIRSLSNGNQTAPKTLDIPKGYFAVYVGESQKKRFVIPISYLNQPSFMDLLSQAEEEFGYDHPMGEHAAEPRRTKKRRSYDWSSIESSYAEGKLL